VFHATEFFMYSLKDTEIEGVFDVPGHRSPSVIVSHPRRLESSAASL
jgi:hypothetical protein